MIHYIYSSNYLHKQPLIPTISPFQRTFLKKNNDRSSSLPQIHKKLPTRPLATNRIVIDLQKEYEEDKELIEMLDPNSK